MTVSPTATHSTPARCCCRWSWSPRPACSGRPRSWPHSLRHQQSAPSDHQRINPRTGGNAHCRGNELQQAARGVPRSRGARAVNISSQGSLLPMVSLSLRPCVRETNVGRGAINGFAVDGRWDAATILKKTCALLTWTLSTPTKKGAGLASSSGAGSAAIFCLSSGLVLRATGGEQGRGRGGLGLYGAWH